ncbi:MAG: chemotaxis protein CheW [Myxococcota bacterium]|nr:chemotaxis protein CheW [Myxococcota bacterium]
MLSHPFLEVVVDQRSRLVRMDAVREIVAMCEAQPVDPSDPVCGVLNLRGEIVPLLELSSQARALTPERFVLVCGGDAEGDFGLVVDEVADIVMVPEANVTLEPDRPAFARVEQALFPVIQPVKVWAQRSGRCGETLAVVDPDQQRLLKLRATHYATHTQAATRHTSEHAVFVRGGRRYAVDLTFLREIRRLRGLCRVPGAPNHIPGVIPSRGRLLSAHDLAAFLSDAKAPDTYRWLVIVEDADCQLGLLVDDVEGIQPIAVDERLPTPIAMGPKASCFGGIVEDDILLIHPAGLFDCPSFSLAQ